MQSKKQKNKSSDINYGHYLELLDRTHVACMMINDHLVEHPLSESDKEIKNQLEYSLGQLYDARSEERRVGKECTNKQNLR